MADTFEEIYRATGLGATQLNDGEHTILTTDSSTRYVIKDMYVNGTSNFTNSYLELNGFNVGSISQNATGSLIVPPSSTLKIKTTDYPYKVYEEKTMQGVSTNQGLVQKRFFDAAGNNVGTDQIAYTGNTTGGYNNLKDMEFVEAGATDYIYYVTTDYNSSNELYYAPAKDFNQGQGESSIQNTGYNPLGFEYTSAYGKVALRFASGQLGYYAIGSNPGTTNVSHTIPTNWANGSINNSYSGTSASYPIAYADHGWFWWVINSGNNNFIYGIYLETGVQIRMQLSNFTMTNNPFVIAYSPSDDKFILYTHYNATYVGYAKFKPTRTTLEALTASTNYATADAWVSHNIRSWPRTPGAGTDSHKHMGYDENGNLGYCDSSNFFVYMDYDGNEIVANRVSNGFQYVNGQTHTADSRIYLRRKKLISAAQITAEGISTPTFDIQLLGVKSV